MSITTLIPIIIIVLAVVIVGFSVKVVPQASEYIVERFGRYQKTLNPGLNIIVPFIDIIRSRVSMKETVLNVNKQEIISKDNASVQVDGIAFFQVIDAKKATYVVNNLHLALENLIMTNIRTVMGSIALDEMLSNRELMNAKLLSVLDEATDPWGVKIVRVEIKDITPPKDLLEAMAKQMKAEREKRATILTAEGVRQSEILKAEGEKQSQILAAEAQKAKQALEAEGYKEAQFREAEARERTAQAEAVATETVSKAIEQGDVKAIQYFVAQKYIEAVAQLAASDNSKTIMMPLEASNIIGSVGGISELLKSMNIKS
ncbi:MULTISPECIES: SPFH domain-containing protein [Cysteiniphilum]|uniref:SPFH domain-containing protein n=1 Tax=Cysteiniphilum TaxID=2056696 RepID=UPI00177F5A68|nr:MULTISPECIES: SPFH domain-containing protein [Cysteiniphilum]